MARLGSPSFLLACGLGLVAVHAIRDDAGQANRAAEGCGCYNSDNTAFDEENGCGGVISAKEDVGKGRCKVTCGFVVMWAAACAEEPIAITESESPDSVPETSMTKPSLDGTSTADDVGDTGSAQSTEDMEGAEDLDVHDAAADDDSDHTDAAEDMNDMGTAEDVHNADAAQDIDTEVSNDVVAEEDMGDLGDVHDADAAQEDDTNAADDASEMTAACKAVDVGKTKTLSEIQRDCGEVQGCKYVSPADADFVVMSGMCCPEKLQVFADETWKGYCARRVEEDTSAAKDADEADAAQDIDTEDSNDVVAEEDMGDLGDVHDADAAQEDDTNAAEDASEMTVACKAVDVGKTKTLPEIQRDCGEVQGCKYVAPGDANYVSLSGLCCPENLNDFADATWQDYCAQRDD